MSDRIYAGRPEFASEAQLDEAADAFVTAMGWRNQERLAENLRNVMRSCDAMKALDRALVRHFNIYRQDQIRQEQRRP